MAMLSREGCRFNRSELATTSNELSDMPIAAAQGGTKPMAASGMRSEL